MASLFLSSICIFWILVSLVTVTANIDSCSNDNVPSSPKNVHDLHPQHIEAVATIGDSISAGVLAINSENSPVGDRDLIQYRGLSWLSGGDSGAKSVFNYVKHYNDVVYGGSIGKRNLPICEETFFCLNASSVFKQDFLNAAMPAAITNHLKNQVNYLNEHMGVSSPYAKKWKMINVFLGTNDLSVACIPTHGYFNFRKNMRTGVAMMKERFDHTIVNLIGLTHSERILGYVDKMDPTYRKPFFDGRDPQDFECICCRATKPLDFLGQADISIHVNMFNSVLKQLAVDYGRGGSLGSDTFAVVYQPFSLDVTSLPVKAISNVDGYHPNVLAYEYFTRTIWNQLYRPKAEKLENFEYETTSELYCPTAKDRIRTD